MEKHPDADQLVSLPGRRGRRTPLQIVTGATNVTCGRLWCPWRWTARTLPGGVKIKKGKLRGVESNGMLCSLGELGLTAHDFPYAIEDGIFILQEECQTLGQDIQSGHRPAMTRRGV